MKKPLLQVKDLCVEFATRHGVLKALDRVSFDIAPGEILGVVGESGAGKSLTGAALIGLLEPPGRVSGGEIWFENQRIDNLPPDAMRQLRGRKIGAIFQDPLTALNPFYTVGNQIAEAYAIHHPNTSKRDLRKIALQSLQKVGIPDPNKRIDQYPHEFSGGMRQRIVIAIALVNSPKLLIADEPTTALDVTVQAQILDLIGEMQQEHGSAVILITHDLGVVAEITKRVLVMYAGRLVESASVSDAFGSPSHPYTLGLLNSVKSLDSDRHTRLEPIPGSPPSLIDLPAGCPFHPRCRFAESLNGQCVSVLPELKAVGNSWSACHLPVEVLSMSMKESQ